MKTIDKIRNEFKALGLLKDKATFECYADGVFCYYIKHEGILHEIAIISPNTTYLKKERIKDLIFRSNIDFLSHRCWDKNDELIYQLQCTN